MVFSSVTSVIIGSGIKTIGNSAFASCTALADVLCYAEAVPTTESNAFESSNIANATLHVPEGAVEAYQAAEPWKNFKEIVALKGGTETDEGDANGDGEVNVADIDFVIESIGADVATHKAADLNGDGEINVADVDYIIERIK